MNKIINKNKIILAITATTIAGFSVFFATAGIFKPNTQVVNDLKSGLIGYFTFDGQDTNWGTATTSDKSGGGYDGTLYNMATSTSPVSGVIGQALNFDGNGDYVFGNVNTNITGLDTITLTAWIKRSGASVTGYESVIETHNSDENEHFLVTNCGDNNIHFGYVIDYTPTAVTFSNSLIADRAWHYLTGVYDRNAGKLYIYVDGVLKNSANASADVTGGNRMIVGGGGTYTGCSGISDNAGWFNGVIDEPRIYNRALSVNEISELYNQGAKRLAKINVSQTDKLMNGLELYYTFDGPNMDFSQTAIVRDSSGNSRHGSPRDYAKATSTMPAPGKIGQAFYCDGNAYFSNGQRITPVINLPSTTITTYSFWAKFPAQIYAYGLFIGSGGSWPTIGIGGPGYANPGKLFYVFGSTVRENNTVLNNNQWYHIGFVRNGNSGTFYINGQADGTVDLTGANTDQPSQICDKGDAGFYGYLDELRIYSRALSASEITELYNQGEKNLLKVNMPQTNLIPNGLVVYWPFDGQQTNWGANTTNDLSGNGNTGAIYNMSTSTSPKAGVKGQALYFDGNNVSFVTANIPSLPVGNSPFTSAAWINLPGTGQYKPIIAWGTQSNGLASWLAVTGGKLSHTFYGLNAGVNGNTVLKTNTWYHAAVTFNGTTSRLYLNGVEDGTANPSPTPAVSGTDFYVGMDSAYDWTYTGKIDEARVYNRALSASEVMELYRAGAGL